MSGPWESEGSRNSDAAIGERGRQPADGARHPKKSGPCLFAGPKMKYRFIQDQRGQFPIAKLCTVLKVSPSGFYDWRKRTPSTREQENQRLVPELRLLQVATRYRSRRPRRPSTVTVPRGREETTR